MVAVAVPLEVGKVIFLRGLWAIRVDIYGSSSAHKGCQEGVNYSFLALLNAATTCRA